MRAPLEEYNILLLWGFHDDEACPAVLWHFQNW